MSLRPRQTSIAPAPQLSFRTSLAPQSTSLDYWWPYGPEWSQSYKPLILLTTSLSSITVVPSSTSHKSPSSSTKIDETINDSPSKETGITGPITSGDDTFNVVTLLPLFIILAVLVIATLVGWTYGRCINRCRRGGEPDPEGLDIGGKPYEGVSYEHDTIGALRSIGVSWVDASRIHSRSSMGSGGYYPIQEVSVNGEAGASLNCISDERGARSWFQSLSGRSRSINLPSGESVLNPPSTYWTHVHQWPAGEIQTQDSSSGFHPLPTHMQSPKTLRMVVASPTTGSTFPSPISSFRSTPLLSASRHVSLRRNIADKVKADDSSKLAMTGGLYAMRRRRYKSSDIGSNSSAWSPDPERHHERMHRLRIAAEAPHRVTPVSEFSLDSLGPQNTKHPLPPAPAVLLSPPLQPHLFFTRTNSDDSGCDAASKNAIAKPNFTRRDSSGNPSRRSKRINVSNDDSFGPRLPPDPTNPRIRKGKVRAHGPIESTETLPLSPELRGAAMTKLNKIVRSHWSIRNLDGVPLSPTFYGALTPLVGHAYSEDEFNQTNIEATLLAKP
ncbi:hypothetical protein RHS01_01617 [Rhizoctonia solani]|uniref:Uncharacterized protein n=1 Tax=Rhizoctonia solani TaxID=456999 RepID=A0A8H7II35_9AGAM|nr:hypothetical protein RHS01_01617 [Rhizoctonia solani]